MPKVNVWIREWLPLVISLTALAFTGLNFLHQSRESELQLWNSLRREFDYELKKERRTCAQAYADGRLSEHYSTVMNFFDTIGFLVRTGRLDRELVDDTWGYDFAGYFRATKEFMLEDRKKDPRSWDDVFYLMRRLSVDPTLKTPEDLKLFFEDEKRLPD